MLNQKIFLLAFLMIIFACQSTQNESAIEQDEIEESSRITLESLRNNDQVKIGPVQNREIAREISCTGIITIPPTAISSIHSKISGQVTSVKYLEGDYVKKGALLTSVQSLGLIEKQRMLLETKAQLEQAGKDFDRKKILLESEATPQKSYDESQGRYELLRSTYDGLNKELEVLGVDIESLESKNEFQTAVPIYATQSGHVHDVMINHGQMITPEKPLMEITNVYQAQLAIQVRAKEIGSVTKGQVVRFTLANSDEEYSAKVIRMNTMLEPGESTLTAICSIEHDDKRMFVGGAFANAKIIVDPKPSSGLPMSAVIKEGTEYFGYRINGEDVVKTRLLQAEVLDDFVVFVAPEEGQWVVEGAYYVE